MDLTRKEFMATLAAAGAGAAFGAAPDPGRREIRGLMLFLGENMWGNGQRDEKRMATDDAVWRRITDRMVERGVNLLLVEIGEGVRLPSHPELSIPQSWSAEKMQDEVRRLRKLGIEAIPKLNFSMGHNGWFTPYRQMPFSPEFYRVQEDLIRDAAEIFDHPRFLHIGYDEEDEGNQRKFDVTIVRRGEAWWRDLLKLVGFVEKHGMRPWMWSDYGWNHDDLVARCPKSVVMSNWWYGRGDTLDIDKTTDEHLKRRIRQFEDFDRAGFLQIPCGSNWMSPTNPRRLRGEANESMKVLVRHCREHVSSANLGGFLIAPWEPTTPKYEGHLLRAVDLLADAAGTNA